MAASTMAKQPAAIAIPARLPPTSSSSETVTCPFPGELSARSPIAKMAGSPAPASRPTTTISQMARRSIQSVMAEAPPLCCTALMRLVGLAGPRRGDCAGPFRVHVLRVHPGAARSPVDAGRYGDQHQQIDKYAGCSAYDIRDEVADRAHEASRRQRDDPGDAHSAGHVPAHLRALFA